LRSLYNYSYDGITKSYNFTTKNGFLYRVAFIEDATLSSVLRKEYPNTFQLIIEKATDGLEPLDSLVSKTIEDIIKRFFQTAENSLIFICSDDQDKAIKRHNAFGRWYENSELKGSISKYDSELSFEPKKGQKSILYTSLIIHNNHPKFETLMEAFYGLHEALNSESEK